ncbi:MAG: heme o synthase [Pseudomonadota bacterium]
MTELSWTEAQPSRGGDADFGDYIELLKPRVMRLVVFTAAVGMLAAPVAIHPVIALAGLVCVAVGAGASGALNMWWDRDIDGIMRRTSGRPIPSGRIAREEALALGLTLSAFSIVMLALFSNLLSAGLLAFTIFFYIVIYSMWLKRSTPQNIVIGGAAGAFPPMIGWAIATGGVSLESVLMFALIFLWTPPHFWALSLFRNDDYARAGVPMMTVVAGFPSTRRSIFVYSLILAATAILVAFTEIGGPVYLAGALILNARLLHDAFWIVRRDEDQAAADGMLREKRFFGFSILYLFLHFVLILVDAILRGLGAGFASWPVFG